MSQSPFQPGRYQNNSVDVEQKTLSLTSGSELNHGNHWWQVVPRNFALSAAVLLAGIALTTTAAYLLYQARSSAAREAFSAWCEERQQLLTRSIDSHIELLYAMRALFHSSDFVSPDEFQRFGADAAVRQPFIRSVGFMRHLTDSERPQFEADYSKLLGRSFSILHFHPDGKTATAPSRAEYAVLVYAQGREGPPVGADALQNDQMPAVISALRSGNAARAVVVSMPGESGQVQKFVHVYLPVYPRSNGNAADPRPQPYGFVRVRFVLEEMLVDIAREAHAVGIEETLSMPPANGNMQIEEGHVTANPVAGAQLSWTGGIPLADRHVLLQLRATDAYAGQVRFSSTWPLLTVGLILTLLATIGAYFLARSRLQAQSLAEDLLIQMRERRLSEERYRVLVENSPDAILLYRQLRVVFVNRAAIKLLGAHSAEDLLGRDILELVHPDFHAEARSRIQRMHSDLSVLPPVEQQLFRLDGSIVDVEVRTVPYMADGEPMLQVTVRDISDRRLAEHERAGLEAALRQSQRLKAIGTLAGGIAHDFNNILSSIVGNIRLVLDDLPPAHPARQSAHEIRNATTRARDLVKRLLTFSTEQEAPQTPIELAPLIDEVQQLLRPSLPAGVVMRTEIPVDTPPVIADATQLHQVLVNLCTNAWQAMPSGQGQIDVLVSTVAADEARSRSKAALTGAMRFVCIEVRDNGSGIPPDAIDRIFEPFFTTKPAGEGSGLGLAVVHGIVQNHHGTITASSTVGVGTSFHLYLPASETPVVAAKVTPVRQSAGANQHVLYIDDEEPLVFLVKRMLERSGYRCTGNTDPRRAVDEFTADPYSFDLVVTDLNMPGMNGIDVAREVLAVRPDLPVVITTGYVRAADVATTRSLGIRELVLKPDTIEELARIVDRYLDKTAHNTVVSD